MAEIRSFQLHPAAIHTFIKAQAGTLAKALSESVMNSIDAFASNVSLTLTATGFVIEDDGQGFRSKEEIAAWFETLGFPHEEGNHRTYGTFGMGRAQAWAFASTVWTTNEFEMDVNVKVSGLDYELRTPAKPFRGTRIVGTFYTPLEWAKQALIETEFKSLVRFTPGVVSFNGLQVNENPANLDFAFETEHAYYFEPTTRAGDLTVYNGGVLVADFRSYRFNAKGMVITKPTSTLQLNLARNDILPSCPIWKEIVKELPRLACNAPKKQVKKVKDAPTQAEIRKAAREVVAGTRTLTSAMEGFPGFLTNVLGRAITANVLTDTNNSHVAIASDDSVASRRAHTSKQAYVLSKRSMEIVESEGLTFEDIQSKAFSERLLAAGPYYEETIKSNQRAAKWHRDLLVLCPELLSDQAFVKESEESASEAMARATLSSAWRSIRAHILKDRKCTEAFYPIRGVKLGTSSTQECWVTHPFLVVRKKEALKAIKCLSHQSALLMQIIATAADYAARSTANKEEPLDANVLYRQWLTTTTMVGDAVSVMAWTSANALLKAKVEKDKVNLDFLAETIKASDRLTVEDFLAEVPLTTEASA